MPEYDFNGKVHKDQRGNPKLDKNGLVIRDQPFVLKAQNNRTLTLDEVNLVRQYNGLKAIANEKTFPPQDSDISGSLGSHMIFWRGEEFWGAKFYKKLKPPPKPSRNRSGKLGRIGVFIALSEILQSDTFRCREMENNEAIEAYSEIFTAYKEAKERGEKEDYPFPAIAIWQEDDRYVLIAGYHRFVAAQKAGIDRIFAKVFRGTEEEAVWFAMTDNRKHGLRLNYGDLKYCIEKALQMFPGKTPAVIARELGCSRSYAYRIDKELSASRQVKTGEKRTGVDGKERTVKRKAVSVQPSEELEQVEDSPIENTTATSLPPEENKKRRALKNSLNMIIEKLQKLEARYPNDRIYIHQAIRSWVSRLDG